VQTGPILDGVRTSFKPVDAEVDVKNNVYNFRPDLTDTV